MSTWLGLFCNLLLFVELFSYKEVDFCFKNFHCGDKLNTICSLGHNCRKSENCKYFKNLPLNQTERDILVELQNDYRSKVAWGSLSRNINGTHFYQAADMNEVVWDKELEFLANCWIRQCPTSDSDYCFKKSDGTLIVQILHFLNENDLSTFLLDIYLNFYYVCAENIDHYTPNPDDKNYMEIRSFLKMMYHNNSKFGCARASYFYPNFDAESFAFICFYAPGLVENKKVYSKGEPCSLCSKCSSKYNGLCSTKQSTSEYLNICKYSTKHSCENIMQEMTDHHLTRYRIASNAPISSNHSLIKVFVYWMFRQIIKT